MPARISCSAAMALCTWMANDSRRASTAIATEPALAEANHDDVPPRLLFLGDGWLRWGPECRDESDFSPY
jgi:hypothetical protein